MSDVMRAEKGFTLIELLVTLAIIGILLGIGVPSFSEFVMSNRLIGQANDFISAISLARSEAVKRGAPVCLARSSATENQWTDGWTVFVDGVANRTFGTEANRCNTAGSTILSNSALSGGSTLTSDGTFDYAIRFNALGVAVNKDDVGVSGSFYLCRRDANTSKSKRIEISITGAPSVGTSAPSC